MSAASALYFRLGRSGPKKSFRRVEASEACLAGDRVGDGTRGDASAGGGGSGLSPFGGVFVGREGPSGAGFGDVARPSDHDGPLLMGSAGFISALSLPDCFPIWGLGLARAGNRSLIGEVGRDLTGSGLGLGWLCSPRNPGCFQSWELARAGNRSLTGEPGRDLTGSGLGLGWLCSSRDPGSFPTWGLARAGNRSLTGELGRDLTGSGLGLGWLCSSRNLDILFMSSFFGEGGWEPASLPGAACFGDCWLNAASAATCSWTLVGERARTLSGEEPSFGSGWLVGLGSSSAVRLDGSTEEATSSVGFGLSCSQDLRNSGRGGESDFGGTEFSGLGEATGFSGDEGADCSAVEETRGSGWSGELADFFSGSGAVSCFVRFS